MAAIVYDIDPAHAHAQFSVRHMMITNVKGEFNKLSGTVSYDQENPANSKIEAAIDVSSLHTRDEQRDTHLKSADFLDLAHYPQITFVSTNVQRQGNGELLARGNLTIHGVTREVTLRVDGPTPEIKDPWGALRAGAEAVTKINRKDFGLVWNVALEAGGVLVGEEVSITIEAELTRRAA